MRCPNSSVRERESYKTVYMQTSGAAISEQRTVAAFRSVPQLTGNWGLDPEKVESGVGPSYRCWKLFTLLKLASLNQHNI